MRNQKTKTLVECALMVALSTILSFITIYEMPQGGSITAVSMMPLVLASFRHGPKWGLFTGFTYGLLQMMLGIKNVMYCTTFGAMVLCVLLDYLLAYGVMGIALPGAAGQGGGRGDRGRAAAVFLQLPFRHSHLAGLRPGGYAGLALLPGL